VLTNDVIDHETYIGGARSAWTSWTPTVTQGVSMSLSANTSKYLKIGSVVFVRCAITFSSTGTVANNIVLTLPAVLTCASSFGFVSIAVGSLLVSTDRYKVFMQPFSSTTQMLFRPVSSNVDAVLGSSVFSGALVSGNTLEFSGMWEVAP
jgi:hypothetical protein